MTSEAISSGGEPSGGEPPDDTLTDTRVRDTLHLLLRSPSFVAGALILAWWVVCALAGAGFAPHDAYASDPLGSLMPPDRTHWCGTDQLGRDICARVIVGARDILSIAPLATLVGTLAGAALGLVTGYFEGAFGTLVARTLDAVLALPLVIVALLVLAAVGASNLAVVLVIGITFAPLVARTVRAAVLAERHLDYVAAARLRGASALAVMFTEILPNVWPPVVVEATVRLGYAIFAVATLSFLGFGIQPPTASWGNMLANAQSNLSIAWWAAVFPGLCILVTVLAINYI
ncbi:MAG: ABC transporter permease, partial [Paraburkholderia sp.]|nr:ABC transporter permease [Paraburkholderia sp.]